MYTVILPMTRAWLLDPLNPTVTISCGSRAPQDTTDDIDGEIRQYAGNKAQIVTRTSTALIRPITFAALTAAQYEQISAWKGRLLLLRTVDGRRIYGGYFSIAKRRYYNATVDFGATNAIYDATANFTQVNGYVESV